MRWLRRVLVVVLLALPVAVVVVVARPGGEAGADDIADSGSGPEGALVAGDTVEGDLGAGEVDAYSLTGEGTVRVGVQGPPPFDATITVVDAEGDEVAFNDDTNNLDPEVTLELDGEELVVEVRELGDQPGTYVVYVDEA